MHNTYSYEGPMELGSVIAHQCGAVGLFSSKDNPDFIIYVSDIRKSSVGSYIQDPFLNEYRQNESAPSVLVQSGDITSELEAETDGTQLVVQLFCHTRVQEELLETGIQRPSELYADYLHIWSISGKDTVEGRKLIGREVLSELRRIMGVRTSLWGTLVGVRPTKLTHKLWDSLARM